MDSNQWTQEEIGGLKLPMGSESTCSSRQQPMVENRKVRPQKEQALNCPRCHSTNTKFCYYNNYSLTQPRYFCKTCRRYWTDGGTLRNVPVGGGSRKNKRSTTTTAPHKLLPDLNPPPNISHHHHHQFASRNPNKILHEGQDLNLGFPAGSSQDHHHCYQANSQFFELPKMDDNQLMIIKSSSSSTPTTPFAALELLRTGLIGSRGMNMNSFITTTTTASPAPDLNAIYTSGFSFQDLKPAAAAVSFSSVDGVPKAGIDQENGGRLMFPFGGMKQVRGSSTSTSEVDHQNKGQPNSNGFWNGMLGGGSW